MSKHRYLVLLRNQAGGDQPTPSPEELQRIFAAYSQWKERFKANILDIGDKLLPGGRMVTAAGVADGPFVEAKEVVGGYMIIAADDDDGAVEVVTACPAVHVPGVSLEVRQLSGARM
jgi:hypothetical protein